MDKLPLSAIVESHQAWINEEPGGKQADLRDSNLCGANLSGANLSRADLSGSDLISADLRGANLSGANLFRADLSDSDLSHADLSGANLRRCILCDTLFWHTIVTCRGKLMRVDMTDVSEP